MGLEGHIPRARFLLWTASKALYATHARFGGVWCSGTAGAAQRGSEGLWGDFGSGERSDSDDLGEGREGMGGRVTGLSSR